ncbi:MarR family winged helix-turn-helix transcriptional regulator [Acetobacter conturbans]|uniref:Winged helix DNA-binding protein n=1 Tax=Acetobacter conturbans TaxID=1737472 RepID=A0ABX0JWV2_9PROT|nr:MarR family winged helix-turn-helix transcriptional regulator [Acetobacter conturbans]NHN87962.1 winged helix DNA-binding protein [Acetobacter conturbans]
MSDAAKDAQLNYDLEQQIGYLLRRAYQRHTSIFQKEISDEHLTSVQFAVMVTVQKLGSAPLVQISHETAIDHATLRDIVSRLKKRDLIKVIQDSADRRQKLVSITSAGKTLLEVAIPAARDITEETLSPLTPCERLAALEVLKKLAVSSD